MSITHKYYVWAGTILLVFFICVPLLTLLPLISNTSVVLLQGSSIMAAGLVIAVTLHSICRLRTLTSLVTLPWNIKLFQINIRILLPLLCIFCNSLWNTVFNARIFFSFTIKLYFHSLAVCQHSVRYGKETIQVYYLVSTQISLWSQIDLGWRFTAW